MSGPAILAALQLQHAFESTYSRQDCIDMIEHWAYGGGDGGLTEQVVRQSCGLPPRDLRQQISCADAVVRVGANTQVDIDDLEDEVWSRARTHFMTVLLKDTRCDLTKHMFDRMKIPRGCAPNMPKADLLAALLTNKVLALSSPRGKSSEVYTLLLEAKSTCEQVLPRGADRSQAFSLPETYSAAAFETYMLENSSREENINTLSACFRGASAKAVRGRPSAETSSKANRILALKKMADKLMDNESRCRDMLDHLTNLSKVSFLAQEASSSVRASAASAASSQDVDAPVPKRQRKKQPQCRSVKDKIAETLPAVLHSKISYEYSTFIKMIRTRQQAKKQTPAAQKLSRRMQYHLLKHTVDLDIKNRFFTVMLQIVNRAKPTPAPPSNVLEVLRQCAKDRDTVCLQTLNTATAVGKQLLLSVLHGAAVPEKYKQCAFMMDLQKTGLYLRWLACGLLPEILQTCVASDEKENPSASALSHLYCMAEDLILSAWVEVLLPLQPQHLSLHYDGVRLSKNVFEANSALCAKCEEAISQKTGFRVTVACKNHASCFDLMEAAARTARAVENLADVFLQDGNCVAAALSLRVSDASQQESRLRERARQDNIEAAQRKSRSYKDVAELFGVSLFPLLMEDETLLTEGKYLAHAENYGRPHCIGFKIHSRGVIEIWNGVKKMRLADKDFFASVRAGIDASTSTVVIFQLGSQDGNCARSVPGMLQDCDASKLLELRAGAKRPAAHWEKPDVEMLHVRGNLPEEEQYLPVLDASSDASEEDQVFDQELCWLDNTSQVLSDSKLLESLEQERNKALEAATRKQAPITSGKFRCVLCPWRAFQRPSRVAERIRRYHTAKRQFCCSGTKQLKVILSLHDSDALANKRSDSYLQRSASLLRQQVRPELSPESNEIDRRIRLLLDG